MAMAGVAAAAEPAGPAVAFAEEEAVVTSCAKLTEKGVEIPLWNETGEPQELTVGFAATAEGGKAALEAKACGGLTLQKPKSLEPGEGGTVVLTLAPGAEGGDSESYSGAVVVYGNDGRVVRKKIEVTKAEAPTRELNATPLAESVKGELTTSERGPLWVPVKPQEPAPAEDGHGTEAVTVGALTGPGDPVAVIWSGKSGAVGEGGKVSKLGLELEGNLKPGTYSGKVDLAADDEDGGTVSLEVKVSRSRWLAGILIAVGILFGIGLMLASGRMLPVARLRGRVTALSSRYDKAIATLREKARDGAKSWDKFKLSDLGTLQDGLCKQINDAKNKTLINVDKTMVTNIEAGITAVESQIDLLTKIPAFAQEVEKALRLPRPIGLPPLNDDGGQERPKLDVEAEETITGTTLKAEEVKARIDAMDTVAKQVRELRKREGELEKLWTATRALEGVEKRKLENELKDCRRRLWTLEDAAGIEEVTKRIQAAWQDLADLEGQPDHLPHSPVFGAVAFRGEPLIRLEEVEWQEGDAETPGRTLSAAFAAAAEPGTPPPPVEDVPPPPLDKDAADSVLNTALGVQVVVIVVSALLALATGMAALYDETWGTFWDGVAAVIWGMVAQAVVTTLAASIDDGWSLNWLRRGQ